MPRLAIAFGAAAIVSAAATYSHAQTATASKPLEAIKLFGTRTWWISPVESGQTAGTLNFILPLWFVKSDGGLRGGAQITLACAKSGHVDIVFFASENETQHINTNILDKQSDSSRFCFNCLNNIGRIEKQTLYVKHGKRPDSGPYGEMFLMSAPPNFRDEAIDTLSGNRTDVSFFNYKGIIGPSKISVDGGVNFEIHATLGREAESIMERNNLQKISLDVAKQRCRSLLQK